MKCAACKVDASLVAAVASGKYMTYQYRCPKCGKRFAKKEKDYEGTDSR